MLDLYITHLFLGFHILKFLIKLKLVLILLVDILKFFKLLLQIICFTLHLSVLDQLLLHPLTHGIELSLKHISFDRQGFAHCPKLLVRLMTILEITLELSALDLDGLPDLTVEILGLEVECSLDV